VLVASIYLTSASDAEQPLGLICRDADGVKLQPLYSAPDAVRYVVRKNEGVSVLVLRARYNASMLPLARLPSGTSDSRAARQEQLVANFIQETSEKPTSSRIWRQR